MLFAPAQTTITGVWASSSRSAEMSMVVSAPRWTPPMPPVANTRIPAIWAMIMVVVTVVAPSCPRAHSTARSRRDALAMACPFLPKYAISSGVSPAFSRPPMMAMWRYRPVFPDDLLHLQSCLHILGVRHSVGDDGRFQSNHRLPLGNGLRHLGFNIQILISMHSSFLQIIVMFTGPSGPEGPLEKGPD